MIKNYNVHLLKTHSVTCECCQSDEIRHLRKILDELKADFSSYQKSLKELELTEDEHPLDLEIQPKDGEDLERKLTSLNEMESHLLSVMDSLPSYSIEWIMEMTYDTKHIAQFHDKTQLDSMFGLLSKTVNQKRTMDELKTKNVLADMFPIWIEKDFASIQNLNIHLPIDDCIKHSSLFRENWDTLNAGLGSIILCLYIFSHKWKLKLKYNPYPLGNLSCIENTESKHLYPVHFDESARVTTAVPHFSSGMNALLASLQEIQQKVQVAITKHKLNVPLYTINAKQGYIENKKKRRRFSLLFMEDMLKVSEKSKTQRKIWNMGIRYILATLKWFMIFDVQYTRVKKK